MWIFFLELIKYLALNHHITSADFHNFKRFCNLELLCSWNWIERIIANKTIKLTGIKFVIIMILFGSSKDILPINRLLWIWSANNILVKSDKC